MARRGMLHFALIESETPNPEQREYDIAEEIARFTVPGSLRSCFTHVLKMNKDESWRDLERERDLARMILLGAIFLQASRRRGGKRSGLMLARTVEALAAVSYPGNEEKQLQFAASLFGPLHTKEGEVRTLRERVDLPPRGKEADGVLIVYPGPSGHDWLVVPLWPGPGTWSHKLRGNVCSAGVRIARHHQATSGSVEALAAGTTGSVCFDIPLPPVGDARSAVDRMKAAIDVLTTLVIHMEVETEAIEDGE